MNTLTGKYAVILDAFELHSLLNRLYNPTNIHHLASKGQQETMEETLQLISICKQITEEEL